MKPDDIISLVSHSLSSQGVQPPVIRKVIEELKQAAEDEKANKEPRATKSKNQVVILVSDPSGKVTALGPQVGWAIQMEESASPITILDRIKEALLSFNRTAKGSKNPVKTCAEVFQYVKGRHWKDEAHPERKTRILTREPVEILPIKETHIKG